MNVFDLSARIGLDSSDYDRGLNQAESGFMRVANGIKSGIGTIAKVTAAGMTAAAAGVAAISKQAVESYADYEQLVGGVETLFGAQGQSLEEYAVMVGKSVDAASAEYDKLVSAQSKVLENANNAFMSAGLSANEYMETVTSFSASLISSLGGDTVKAAEYADKAIVDMSDNANKMGTSMEAIQNAYNGFAKQNYTMLDNLKLGYGGTKEEMQRLLDDAEKLSGIKFDISSFGDIVEAIHVVQKEMHISGISAEEAAEAVKNGTMTEAEALAAMGTTAREAATTISGSVNMMKSSWTNLIAGVANDEADFDKLIDNFVSSVDTAAKNIIPRVEIAIQGVGKLVEKLVPTILERVPELIENTLPALADSAMKMIGTLGQALVNNADQLLVYVNSLLDDIWNAIKDSDVMSGGLEQLIGTLAERIPQIFSNITMIAVQIVRKLSEGLQDNNSIGVIMEAVSRIVYDIAETIAVMVPEITNAAFELIKGLGQGLLDNIPWLLDEAITLVEDLAGYIAEAAPKMIPKIVELVGQLAEMLTRPDAISRIIDAAIEIINGLVDGLLDAIPVLIDAAPQIIQNLVDAITENLPKILDCAWELVKKLTEALLENTPALIEAGGQIIDSIGTGIVQALMQVNDWIDSVCQTIADLIVEAYQFAVEAAEENIGKMANALVQMLSAIVPKVLNFAKKAKQWGISLITNMIAGFKKQTAKLKAGVIALSTTIKTEFNKTIKKATDWGKDLIQKITDGIKNKISAAKQAMQNINDTIKNKFKEIIDKAMSWGKDLIQKIVDGIKNKVAAAKQAISDVTTAIKNKFKETIDNAINWGKDLIQKIVDGVKAKIQAVKDAIADVKKAISDKFEEIIKAAIDWGKNLIGNFVDNVSSKWNEIKNKISEVKDAIANKFGELVDGAVTWGKQTISHFVSNIVSKWNEIREKVVNVADKVTEIFTGLVNAAQDWGIDMITEFIKGITGSKPELTATIDAIAEIIKARLHHTTPDKGPLANDDTYMPDMMKLFSQGIRQNAYMVTDALDSTLYKIQNAFELPHTAIGNVMTANNYAVSDIPKEPVETTVYNGGDNIYNITVNVGTIATDYDANRAAQVMSERLAALQSQQRRAIGL